MPAYILTIGYLLMSILSLALIVSLRSDQTPAIFPIKMIKVLSPIII